MEISENRRISIRSIDSSSIYLAGDLLPVLLLAGWTRRNSPRCSSVAKQFGQRRTGCNDRLGVGNRELMKLSEGPVTSVDRQPLGIRCSQRWRVKLRPQRTPSPFPSRQENGQAITPATQQSPGELVFLRKISACESSCRTAGRNGRRARLRQLREATTPFPEMVTSVLNGGKKTCPRSPMFFPLPGTGASYVEVYGGKHL